MWWEQDSEILGGPFLIMEQIPGPTLLQALMEKPWRVIELVRKMIQVQMKLHQLPLTHLPYRPGRLLDRTFTEMESLIGEHGWHGLDRGLSWLQSHEVLSPCRRSARLLHLDFHPLNLIERPGQLPVVLDWGTADIGDPHADIATTLMLLRCAPIVGKSRGQRAGILLGRKFVEQFYLIGCHRQMEVCERKLAYYHAWAVLRRLVSSLCFRVADPMLFGVKPSMRSRLPQEHLEDLVAEFQRLTGVQLHLPERF
jgi:aminoglycoside phosphotransferase (APT) family kinase protein